MKLLFVYLRLYRDSLASALDGIRRNPWTLLLPMGLAVALWLLSPLALALGALGGLALALAFDAVASCYLYFTGEVVALSRVSLKEFRKSIGAYFWSVMNLLFVIWIVNFVLGLLLAGSPQAGVVRAAEGLLILALLNPAPEVIYLRGTRNGMETIQRSVKFVQENWIEWFVPNLLVLGLAYLAATRVLPQLGAAAILALAAAGALLHVFMVFRGHLFKALDGTSHRQRMYRQRTASSET
ncbi:MAG: hypothetical protein ACYC8T_32210 [Myxococcaceae bacterium]